MVVVVVAAPKVVLLASFSYDGRRRQGACSPGLRDRREGAGHGVFIDIDITRACRIALAGHMHICWHAQDVFGLALVHVSVLQRSDAL